MKSKIIIEFNKKKVDIKCKNVSVMEMYFAMVAISSEVSKAYGKTTKEYDKNRTRHITAAYSLMCRTWDELLGGKK